jgi:DNA mismatch endonuclease (patch repair protein)
MLTGWGITNSNSMNISGSVPSKTRSYNMSRIRCKDTKPELLVRKWLWSKGYRYRLHAGKLAGKPDIVFPGRLKAIFIHGCFWHGHDCRYFKWPRANSEFWSHKIGCTVLRDKKNYAALVQDGWRCIVIWECETKAKNLSDLWSKVEEFLAS